MIMFVALVVGCKSCSEPKLRLRVRIWILFHMFLRVVMLKSSDAREGERTGFGETLDRH